MDDRIQGAIDMNALSTIAVLAIALISAPAMGQGSISSPKKAPSIAVGTLADTVLKIRGKGLSSKQVGRDEHGLLVEWEYADVTYLMGRRLQGGIEAYRVIKITPRR